MEIKTIKIEEKEIFKEISVRALAKINKHFEQNNVLDKEQFEMLMNKSVEHESLKFIIKNILGGENKNE